MNSKDLLAIRVSNLRNGLGTTQQDFSDRVRISRAKLSEIEHGSATTTTKIVEAIASSFAIDVGFLVSEDYLRIFSYYYSLAMDVNTVVGSSLEFFLLDDERMCSTKFKTKKFVKDLTILANKNGLESERELAMVHLLAPEVGSELAIRSVIGYNRINTTEP